VGDLEVSFASGVVGGNEPPGAALEIWREMQGGGSLNLRIPKGKPNNQDEHDLQIPLVRPGQNVL